MVLMTVSTVYLGLIHPNVMDGSVLYITLNSCGITCPQVHTTYLFMPGIVLRGNWSASVVQWGVCLGSRRRDENRWGSSLWWCSGHLPPRNCRWNYSLDRCWDGGWSIRTFGSSCTIGCEEVIKSLFRPTNHLAGVLAKFRIGVQKGFLSLAKSLMKRRSVVVTGMCHCHAVCCSFFHGGRSWAAYTSEPCNRQCYEMCLCYVETFHLVLFCWWDTGRWSVSDVGPGHTEVHYLALRVLSAVGQAILSEAGESHGMGERPPNSC